MKKKMIPVLGSIFLMIPSLGFNFQAQEHQHRDLGLKQYDERQIKDEDRFYWQMPQRVMDELGSNQG